ncbi:DUF3298 and DUF4163 domain-containing protein [Paenibacillus rhizophilus]|uniref:DUF3298/DUF4163 domain-containing protein n=1 Tax=Paenibacillus rhizophilus TaxID=1850366 RepID=A0A3N9Q034_9BACL|nr:DUF3298 and DUF4163 domain-containing protein [Paenibacillus rhizophilus]RQW10826.1 DUF3298/DUF4163 domain-containing protein [Paenibacillus rhizophilus]
MNKTKKLARRWGAGMIAAGLLLGGTVFPAATGEAAPVKAKADYSPVALKFNGTLTSQQGIFREGKIWIPVTFLKNSLGLPINYDKAENSYSLGQGIRQTKLMLSEYGISLAVNGYFINEYEGRNFNNRLYVPFGLLSDYLGYLGDFSASSGRLNVMHRPLNKLTVTTETYTKEADGATVQLDYPQISGLADASAQKSINDTLNKAAMSFAAGADRAIAEKSEQDRPYEFDSKYVVTYNQDGVLSLVMSQYGYTGGAHGTTLRQAFTFSLKDGKRLLLGDLFGANPNYKKLLNEKVGRLLKADEGYFGGFNGLNTEKYFYLKDGRVVLFFQLYEYTPYAEGFPEFTFAFKELLPDGSSPFAGLK